MQPKQFVAKWGGVVQKERAVSWAEIEELDDIHVGLDTAVLQAYNWPPTLTDEQILEHLLALNLERAAE